MREGKHCQARKSWDYSKGVPVTEFTKINQLQVAKTAGCLGQSLYNFEADGPACQVGQMPQKAPESSIDKGESSSK